jgi:YidC/Oxa1 family membrane protein insertase
VRPGSRWRALVPFVLVAIVLLVAACAPGGATPGASPGAPTPTPTPAGAIPVHPASPGADPFSLLAWLFTPVFQLFFIALVVFDKLTGNIAIAIVILTILLRIVLIPPFRRQTVSTRRMQMLAPEVKEIQRRNKGNRTAAQAAIQELYRERGVNPLSGCLPLLLTFVLLIPMYSVFSQGLQSFNVQPMLDVFGVRLIDLHCPSAPEIVTLNGQAHVANPCLNPNAFGVNWGVPEILFGQPGLLSGFSVLALISALLQLVQSRMSLPAQGASGGDDPNTRVQRQMAYLFPFISLAYGSLLPAGLFLYWIVSTLFTIVQQYLIIGWGGMFPLFGWTPGFARDHQPRFPVTMPPPADPSKKPASQNPQAGGSNRGPNRGPVSRTSSADKTIRPRERGRQGRRGRRR